MGKIIHHAIGNDPQRDLVPGLPVQLHQTVYGIIQCRVSTDDDDSLVAVVDEHSHQPFHTSGVFTLDKVIVHMILLESPFYLLPTLSVSPSAFRAIENAPFVLIYHKNIFLSSPS